MISCIRLNIEYLSVYATTYKLLAREHATSNRDSTILPLLNTTHGAENAIDSLNGLNKILADRSILWAVCCVDGEMG